MISTFTAFFDSNVFFGARLRSLVLYLAQTGLFRARWSEDVHREWMTAVVRRRPGLTMADVEPTRQCMDTAVLDACVVGYESLMPAITLPDPDDRHVLAAAIRARASLIVTFNEKDFPASALVSYGIDVRHPDDFVLDVESLDPLAVVKVIAQDIRHYVDPPIDVSTYLDDLRRSGLPKTADYLNKISVLLPKSDAEGGKIRVPRSPRPRTRMRDRRAASADGNERIVSGSPNSDD